jgi:4-hydroxy-tetrahydrodipicolinate synthase
MGEIRGLFTAMVTPFRPDGSVNDEAGVALARHLIEQGSHGLVICGTTGEATTMCAEEIVGFVRLIASELGADHPIYAGAGSNDTAHAAHLTEAVVEAGAQAVLSVTPYYNKPNRRGIVAHFDACARVTDKPIVVYNIPGRCVIDIPNDLLAELAQLPNVSAVKQARTEDIAPIDGLDLLAGNDDMLRTVMDVGGTGGILVASHLFGAEMKRIVEEPDVRAEVDDSLRDAYAVLGVTVNPIPVKTAMHMLGLDPGNFRLPMVPASDEEAAEVRAMLERHGLLSKV